MRFVMEAMSARPSSGMPSMSPLILESGVPLAGIAWAVAAWGSSTGLPICETMRIQTSRTRPSSSLAMRWEASKASTLDLAHVGDRVLPRGGLQGHRAVRRDEAVDAVPAADGPVVPVLPGEAGDG